MVDKIEELPESGSSSDSQTGSSISTVHLPLAPPIIPHPVPQGRGTCIRRLFLIIFYLQLILVAILAIVLTSRGFLSARKHHFHPVYWFPPILTSIGCAGLVSFAWHWSIQRNQARTLKAAFWLGPSLTCGVGVLLVLIESSWTLAVGVIVVFSSVAQALYYCWVIPRLEYATRIIWITIDILPENSTALLCWSIVATSLYSAFMVCGIGGATAVGTKWDTLFIFLILLSMTWTMHVIKNVLLATIARIKHLSFSRGVSVTNLNTYNTLWETLIYPMGSICIGSALVPIFGVIRGSARGLITMAGGTDEFMFSCADCYLNLAARLTECGNRWGFVHVGVLDKEFLQASKDVWNLFKRAELVDLIDSDLTGVFCFLCGLSSAGVSSIVAGSWAFATHRSYASEVILCAFLIGYFMCRIAMAWTQACVAAYYVAYAENPNNNRFDETILVRLEEMKRYRD